MRSTYLLFCIVAFGVLLTACEPADPRRTAENPDPNHTHADFLIFVDGEKIDLSGQEFMSGLEGDDDHDHEHKHDYLHLHDAIGYVVHRHKPGLTIGEFFASLDLAFEDSCLVVGGQRKCDTDGTWRMVLNHEEVPFMIDYAFEDLDQILLTTSQDDTVVQSQWDQMPDDSCLYSRTCPQRGDPPAENCIADPAVPCVEVLE